MVTPRGFESHSLRNLVNKAGTRPRRTGGSSGLRRTIGNRVDIVRVGSNPTPSVFKTRLFRGVAQSGRALRSGRRGPRFESGRPD